MSDQAEIFRALKAYADKVPTRPRPKTRRTSISLTLEKQEMLRTLRRVARAFGTEFSLTEALEARMALEIARAGDAQRKVEGACR